MSDFAMMQNLPALASMSEKLLADVCTTLHSFSKESGTPSLNEAPLGEDMFPTWKNIVSQHSRFWKEVYLSPIA